MLLEDEGTVLTCGGFGCDEISCEPRRQCYTWSPDNDEWTLAPELLTSRSNFLLVGAPDTVDGPDNRLLPLALGNLQMTEILSEGAWKEHLDLVDNLWLADNCLVEADGLIYYLRLGEVRELNLYTWETNLYAPLPEPLDRSFRCSVMEIDQEKGVLLPQGHWFSLRSKSWRKLATPRLDPVVSFQNSLYAFGGRPTFFGAAICEDNADCQYNQVK